MITMSVVKACGGGLIGHASVHPDMIAAARQEVAAAVSADLLVDGYVADLDDDIALILTHTEGPDSRPVHSCAWTTVQRTVSVAKELGLYAAGGEMLPDAFSENLRGMGPAFVEVEFDERPVESVVCLLADRTEPGAWNLPLCRSFADPFTTAGLVADQKMRAGFGFEVYDLWEDRRIVFDCPADLYDLLACVSAPARYAVHHVRSKTLGIPAAATGTQRLPLVAGGYGGTEDPLMIVRCESGLPSVGEVLEPFAFPYSVAGAVCGSHHAPYVPVAAGQPGPSRFGGAPRVVALGFQIRGGRLIGPRDLFADAAFHPARARAGEVLEYFRRHGPFEPHRLGSQDSSYPTGTPVPRRLAHRWTPVAAEPPATRQPTAESEDEHAQP
ncbi:fructose 1,6-bisphosphatase [Microbispora sp. ATCC PTA-5024]|uniref:fructose 1,6-bisphosphatase n=1 Tax=Microbispora sp. ATCC PTA-5024 TaxID=316330 RepID=UPI0003DDAB36|nr:fructose 1,6-bisphosphatase [Microbispora sp. ATCC PTA-5024]ETK32850.1 fructose-1 6-bisphosphatase [Microbispora sp. ATCC PTA-5024]